MTLREKLIEAGAKSMYESSTRELREMEASLVGDRYEFHARAYQQYAEAALDAMLDVLAESWKDWRDASWEHPVMPTEKRLIEALREDP